MFQKAERKRARLKLLLTGPSGSGKTLSALMIAKGIGGRVAVIDTENDSASLYAGDPRVPAFDVVNLKPPYTTDNYLNAMAAATKGGYDVLIVDSGTHQWAGEGGILNRKEQLDARGGDSFRNWGKLSPEQERFKSAILHAPMHLIMTLRSKQDYAMVAGEAGRKASIQKLGMAPIQREGMEYEFTLSLDMGMSHDATASKDRTGLFDGRIFKPTSATGEELLAWLTSGAAAQDAPEESGKGDAATNGADPAQAILERDDLNRKMMALYQPFMKLGTVKEMAPLLQTRYGVKETRLMTIEMLNNLVEYMAGELSKTGVNVAEIVAKGATKKNGMKAAQDAITAQGDVP